MKFPMKFLFATLIIGFLSFLGPLTYNLYVWGKDVAFKAKYSEPTSLAADIFLWGAILEESTGLEMKTEGSCHPIPIRWPPTEEEGGLRYNVPLRAPCQKNHFKWTLNKQIVPAGPFIPKSWKLVKELTTTLEGVTEADLVDTLFTPDPVSNLRQDKEDLLRWTSSPCAEKYVVRVMGNPRQEFETATNWIQLNLPDHCEEIPVEVEAYSGDQRSPAVPVLFSPCASEKDEDGEPASWVKASSLLSKKEQQKKPCAPFASSEQFEDIKNWVNEVIVVIVGLMIVVIRDFVTYPEHFRPAIPTIPTSLIRTAGPCSLLKAVWKPLFGYTLTFEALSLIYRFFLVGPIHDGGDRLATNEQMFFEKVVLLLKNWSDILFVILLGSFASLVVARWWLEKLFYPDVSTYNAYNMTLQYAYTQVAHLGVYLYFAISLFGCQRVLVTKEVRPGVFMSKEPEEMDLYIPIFLLLKLGIYMCWLKEASNLFNPFGNGNDDFLLMEPKVSREIVDDNQVNPLINKGHLKVDV